MTAAALALLPAVGIDAQKPAGGFVPAPPPAFADPGRAAALTGAFPAVDRIFQQFAERSRVPGIAWGILIDGRLVHTSSAGVREVASKAPVDSDTVFRIASMTKSFTALCILRLRDQGKLSLDDPAERYVSQLRGLKYPTADSPRITIRHLLSHAEGFPEDNPWGDRQLDATGQQMLQMIESGIPFSNPPGQAYEYSNFGFAILGRIVSVVSGMPYRDYVQQNILTPLGMTSTTFDPSSVAPGRLAHGYRLEDGAWKEEPLLADGAFGAMGGLLTTTRDLAKWVGFLMSAWPARDDADTGPARRSSVREMQQVWRPAPATVTRDQVDSPLRLNTGGYGFGLRVWQSCGQRHLVAHGGGLPGFGSHMRWLPEHGVGIIALGNLTYTSWTSVADAVVDALDATGALQPRVPVPAPALAEAQDAVNRLIDRWDDVVADRIAAVNLFLDESKPRRRASIDRARAQLGACRPAGAIEAENALRGTWKLACDRGTLRVAVTLAPTAPPRVQLLTVTPVVRPEPALANAIDRLVRQIDAPDAAGLKELLAPGLDVQSVMGLLKAAAAWGSCRFPVELLSSDGVASAAVRLSCARGGLALRVGFDAASGRVTRLSLAPASGTTCVP